MNIPWEAKGSVSDRVSNDWWCISRLLSTGVRGSDDSACERVDETDLEGGRVYWTF